MTPFQILAILVLGLLLATTVAATVRGWASRRECVIWSTVWLASAIAIAWPGVTARVARILGIGRGADLVLYCSVVVMMLGFMMVYVRLRRLRREMTILVREIALRDAVIQTPPPPQPPDETNSA